VPTSQQHPLVAAPNPEADLDARYGRTPGGARRRTRLLWIAAAAFAVVIVAWVVWGSGIAESSKVDAVDAGHLIVDDTLVQVRYELSLDPGETASCAAQALNSTFSIVGWNIVDIPASEQRTRTLGVDVRTTERSVTGLIYRCWLT
jgi:hypothetical protein